MEIWILLFALRGVRDIYGAGVATGNDVTSRLLEWPALPAHHHSLPSYLRHSSIAFVTARLHPYRVYRHGLAYQYRYRSY